MGHYRKKPVVVEAMQVTDGHADLLRWLCDGEAVYIAGFASGKVIIRTLEGNMEARMDEWIIKGVAGEFYPCKPDIFDATYEPVDVE